MNKDLNKEMMQPIADILPGPDIRFRIPPKQMYFFKPQRDPMSLIDEITDCNMTTKEVTCLKRVRLEDPYVAAHFPDDPFMPTTFVIEAMAQASGSMMNLLYLQSRGVVFQTLDAEGIARLEKPPFNVLAESKIRHVGLVLPGETLTVHAKLFLKRNEVSVFRTSAEVGDRPIASGEMILAYPLYTPIPPLDPKEIEEQMRGTS